MVVFIKTYDTNKQTYTVTVNEIKCLCFKTEITHLKTRDKVLFWNESMTPNKVGIQKLFFFVISETKHVTHIYSKCPKISNILLFTLFV